MLIDWILHLLKGHREPEDLIELLEETNREIEDDEKSPD